MKARISLQYIRHTQPRTLQPFWFTLDRSMYLNQETPSLEIELNDLSFVNLAQLYNGVMSSIISINDTKALEAAVNKFRQSSAPEVEIKTPDVIEPDIDDKPVEKVHPKLEEIKTLLTKSVKDIVKEVGSTQLNDNQELPMGIGDKSFLEEMIKLEKTSDTPRNGVIKKCNKRIRAIEECNGFMVEDDPEMIITEKDLRK